MKILAHFFNWFYYGESNFKIKHESMSKSKQLNQDYQSSQHHENGSGVGNQFQPNQGLGSIEDTKQNKKQAKQPGRMSTNAPDPEQEETGENKEVIDQASFDDAEGDDSDSDENK